MATVEKRGKKWCVRYWVMDSLGNWTGQKRVSGFNTKEDAMAAARDLERASNAGVDVHGDVKTCGELMETWFAAKVGHIAETTLAKYSAAMDVLQTHPVYATRIQKLNKDSLQTIVDDLMESRGLIRNTAYRYTEPLRLALSWGLKQGLILINPLAGAAPIRLEPKEQKILSDADVRELVQTCRERNPYFLPALLLVVYGGLRREECAALTWDNVDFEKRLVRITSAETSTSTGKRVKKGPKTKTSKRSVSFPGFVMDELRAHKKRQPEGFPYVCMSRRGVQYDLGSYSHAVLDLVDYINSTRPKYRQMPRVGFHDLRHTHAAMLIHLGIQPKVISERLGHASIKITMDLYGYLMPGLQEAVADALEGLG